MTTEFSAGGIVFNNEGQVLLTQNGQANWQFPKGHLEKGETEKEAALREVKEEGGVEAEIIKKVGVSKYTINFNGQIILKNVTIFLMKYLSGDIKDHDHEVADSSWENPLVALKKLTFDPDRELLKKAIAMNNEQ